jgi:hypothetical protein
MTRSTRSSHIQRGVASIQALAEQSCASHELREERARDKDSENIEGIRTSASSDSLASTHVEVAVFVEVCFICLLFDLNQFPDF